MNMDKIAAIDEKLEQSIKDKKHECNYGKFVGHFIMDRKMAYQKTHE